MRTFSFLLGLLAIVSAVPGAYAQEAHLQATVAVEGGTNTKASPGRGIGQRLPKVEEIRLEVTCNARNCQEVRAIGDSAGQRREIWTRGNASETVATFSAPRSAVAGTDSLILYYAGQRLPGFSLAAQDNDPPADITSSLTGAPLILCEGEGQDSILASSRAGHPVFVVGPVANVLYRTHSHVRENDQVVVFVRGPRSVVRQIAVRRSSDFQQIGDFPLVGEGSTAPDGLAEYATGRDTDPDNVCVVSPHRVENFAGGKAGQVELSYATIDDAGKTERNVTGTFDFGVRRLYRGALSLGVMRTDLQDPTYSVAEGDSVLLESGAGRRYGYALFLTPFIWGRRDVEEWSLYRLPMYITPSVGVGLEKIGENALLGATLELPAGLFLTAGWHAGKVDRPVSGLRPGMVVPSSRRTAPSESRWEHGVFYSLSVDLRAASKFFSAAGGK